MAVGGGKQSKMRGRKRNRTEEGGVGKEDGKKKKVCPVNLALSQFTQHLDIWRILQGNREWHREQHTYGKTVLISSK